MYYYKIEKENLIQYVMSETPSKLNYQSLTEEEFNTAINQLIMDNLENFTE